LKSAQTENKQTENNHGFRIWIIHSILKQKIYDRLWKSQKQIFLNYQIFQYSSFLFLSSNKDKVKISNEYKVAVSVLSSKKSIFFVSLSFNECEMRIRGFFVWRSNKKVLWQIFTFWKGQQRLPKALYEGRMSKLFEEWLLQVIV
jgi:hypothetical protein